MLLGLLPGGHFGPATWKVLFIVLIVAIIGVAFLAWLLVYAAGVAQG